MNRIETIDVVAAPVADGDLLLVQEGPMNRVQQCVILNLEVITGLEVIPWPEYRK